MDDLLFLYESKDGTISERILSRWRDFPTFIIGYCELTGAVRSFSKQRIVEWLELPIGVYKPHQAEEPAPPPAPRRAADILFTGFKKGERARLEEAARCAGLVVRTTVTNELTVLVAGPNAGWAKLQRAGEIGATVIHEEDCAALFADGILP